MKLRGTHHKRAFTLIELLVVISIIGLLIALLLPALVKARESGRVAQCLTQQRQMRTAAAAYQVENKEHFPYQVSPVVGTYYDVSPSGNPQYGANGPLIKNWSWLWCLLTYLQQENSGWNVLVCPTARYLDQFQPEVREYHNSYRACGPVTALGGFQYKNQSRVVAFFDNPTPTNGCAVRPYITGNPANITDMQAQLTQSIWAGWMMWRSPPELVSNQPHNEGRVHAFLDGHAELRKWSDVTCSEFGILIGTAPNGQDIQEQDQFTDFGYVYFD